MKKPSKRTLRAAAVLVVAAAAVGGLFLLNFYYKIDRSFRCVEVPQNPAVWQMVRNLDSDGKKSTRYDLYLPQPADSVRNYSLILYIHGGSFTGGDKREGRHICPYYASKGLVAASVNYTLYRGPGTANLFSLYDEIISTTYAIKDECAKRGYNITEMAFTGFSAGGYTALLCAYKNPNAAAVPVKFVFEQSAPASFEPDLWGKKSDKRRAAFISLLTGKKYTADDVGTETFQEAVNAISPSAMVSAETVPTVLAYGPHDWRVPPAQKFPLLENLEKYKVPHDYIEFPHSGHRLFDDLDRSEVYFRTVDAYIERYFDNFKK